MDLKLFFSPIAEADYASVTKHNTVLKNIKVNFGKMPDHKDADIALIGIEEDREINDPLGISKASKIIRQRLFNLKKGYGTYRIIDLGNLANGIDVDETRLRLREVCHYLILNNVLPVIIGGTHDMDLGQYMAYEDMEKLVSMLVIDSRLDMEDGLDVAHRDDHLQRILLHEPNYLFHISLLAYQSYLTDEVALNVLEKLYFETHRLGYVRQHLHEMEPVVRDADMLSFDVSAIRSADAPGAPYAMPFGLTGEEACQLCWYAGLNEKLSSVGFYEYYPEADDEKQNTAAVIATMIWYFIEGFYHRKDEKDFRANDYLQYNVPMPAEPEKLTFYKSKRSEKWWLEVPHPGNNEKIKRMRLVPCSYKDYEKAINGELPDRWITTFAKLI